MGEPVVENDRREQADFRDEVRDLMRQVGQVYRHVQAVPESSLIIGTDRISGSYSSPAVAENFGRRDLLTELRRAKQALSNARAILDGQW